MDVQQGWGYNWTQGDLCRAIFSVFFTGRIVISGSSSGVRG